MSYEESESSVAPPIEGVGATDASPGTNGGTAPAATPADRLFVATMQDVGLLSELADGELEAIASQIADDTTEARRLDLLEHYYWADGDEDDNARRVGADRFFAHRDDVSESAIDLVLRLNAIAPEVGEIVVERIGTAEGPLVLRSGKHFSAIVDELEDEGTVSVRGLVRSLNRLLARRGVRQRLVELRGDGSREAFVGLSVAEAMTLCAKGMLEEDEPEQVMDFCGW